MKTIIEHYYVWLTLELSSISMLSLNFAQNMTFYHEIEYIYIKVFVFKGNKIVFVCLYLCL